jgi:putative tricarboxylic transport membrane protein
MANPDTEIVVEDPTAPEPDSPPVTNTRTVNVAVMLLLLGLAILLGYDNWRTGASWESTGPQAGYMPFYLSIILAAAALYGLLFGSSAEERTEPFVTWAQLRRVMQVLVPTFLFVLGIGWLGLYLSSFILVTGFMWAIGRIALWKSLLTGFVFSAAMFITFQVAFNVIMPKGPLEAFFGY